MSGEKISQLPVVSNAAVGANSIIPLVDSTDSTTKSIALSQLDLRWATKAAGNAAITALTGDVTAPTGTGSRATTLANNVVTNAKAAQMPANTIKGNNTGSTANAIDLTVLQLQTMLNIVFPVGLIVGYGGTTAPSGWLLAGSGDVSRTTYANLFAVFGTVFGVGDGSTTFGLPTPNGIFFSGAGTQTVGGIAYTKTLGAIQSEMVGPHIHPVTANIVGVGGGGGQGYINGSGIVTGQNTGTETRPANQAINFIIKT